MLRVPLSTPNDIEQNARLNSFSIAEAADLGALAGSVGYLIGRAQLELTRQFLAGMGKRNRIKSGAFSVLSLASANPGIGQMHIARRLGLDKANVATLIRSLVNADWLARRRVADDQRCQGVFLTPGGVARLAAMKREMRDLERHFCASLNDAEKAALVALLVRVSFGEC
jgi:DNA-binding MarR family transcriptional regulator